MIISNNVLNDCLLKEKTIVRINSAWVGSKKELSQIIIKNRGRDVFLDFPSGRTKPPKPKLKLCDLITLAKKHKNVKYFAVSNAENTKELAEIRRKLPSRIELVPKIESLIGVEYFRDIMMICKSRTAMLDKEDLYLDALGDCYTEDGNKAYEEAVKAVRGKSEKLGVKLYELKGVIFG